MHLSLRWAKRESHSALVLLAPILVALATVAMYTEIQAAQYGISYSDTGPKVANHSVL